MHENGIPLLYGPCVSFIVSLSPSTSVTTAIPVLPALVVSPVFVFEDVGSFADGIALCFEKASVGFVCKVDAVVGVGDRDLDLTYTCMIGLFFGAGDLDLDLIGSCALAFRIVVTVYQEMKQGTLASIRC